MQPQWPPTDRPGFFALVPPPRPRDSAPPPPAQQQQPRTTAPHTTAGSKLRIASWNVGLRGLAMMCSPNSSDALGPADCHGIRRKQSYGGLGPLLRAVDADIVCLQEVKLKELGAPERALALEEGWDSYFSLCRVRTNSTSHGRYFWLLKSSQCGLASSDIGDTCSTLLTTPLPYLDAEKFLTSHRGRRRARTTSYGFLRCG